MLEKITKIKDIQEKLNDSILCLIQPKNEECYNFGYITRNSKFTESFFGCSMCRTLDILEKKILEEDSSKKFSGFYGEVFKIASLKRPDYGLYLQELNFEKTVINFSHSLYSLVNDFCLVEVKEVIESDEYCYQLVDDTGEIFYVNEFGRDRENNWIVSNYKESFFEEVFQEQEGYLYLTNQHGPLFVSKDVYNKFEHSDDILNFLNITDNHYEFFPVLNIIFDDEIVDTILLDTKKKENTKQEPDYSNFHESLNPNIFEKYKDDSNDVYETAEIIDENNWEDLVEIADNEIKDESNDDDFDWDDEVEIEDETIDDDFNWDDEIEIDEEDK